jgi:hypothetical protein
MSDNDIQEVLDQLSVLEPSPLDAPRPAAQALARLRPRLRQRAAHHAPSFWQRLFAPSPGRRWAFSVTAVFLILAFSFTFPAVRAAASDFLGLFRVQKFAAISISPEQLALLESLSEEGFDPGEVNIEQEPGGLTPVMSLAEAASRTGLTPRTLAGQGDPERIGVIDGGRGSLTVNLEGMRAIIAAAGADPQLLPDELDGQQIRVAAFPGVEQQWADGIWLVQTAVPLVEYPAEIGDPQVLAQAFLQVLGLDEAEAARLAREIDWTSTLLLPLPADAVSFREITVDGVTGLALQSLDGRNAALVWQKEGVIYLLQGERPPEALQALVEGGLKIED